MFFCYLVSYYVQLYIQCTIKKYSIQDLAVPEKNQTAKVLRGTTIFATLYRVEMNMTGLYEGHCIIVNDRSAKNVVRPNRTSSAISTEGSAEPFGRTSAIFGQNFGQILVTY